MQDMGKIELAGTFSCRFRGHPAAGQNEASQVQVQPQITIVLYAGESQ